jgi:hypothetical protein
VLHVRDEPFGIPRVFELDGPRERFAFHRYEDAVHLALRAHPALLIVAQP